MSSFKKGDLVMCVGGTIEDVHGRIFSLADRCPVYPDSWIADPPQFSRYYREEISFQESTLRLIPPAPKEDLEEENVKEMESV